MKRTKGSKAGSNLFSVLGAEELAWGDAGAAPLPARPGPRRSAGPRDRHARAEEALLRRSSRTWTTRPAQVGRLRPHRAGRRQRRRRHPHELPQGRQALGPQRPQVLTSRTARARRGRSSSRRSIPSLGRAGHRAFVVEKGTPGFSVGKIEEKMGLRANETAELVLEDCRVPEENLLGGEEKYVIEGRLHDRDEDLRQHAPAGRARWRRHRPRRVRVRARLREGELRALAADPALRGDRRAPRARRPRPRGRAHRSPGARRGWPTAACRTRRKPACAKAVAGQAAIRACIEAIEICGAHGSIATDHALLEKWFRDIKVYDIFEGTGQIQRIVISSAPDEPQVVLSHGVIQLRSTSTKTFSGVINGGGGRTVVRCASLFLRPLPRCISSSMADSGRARPQRKRRPKEALPQNARYRMSSRKQVDELFTGPTYIDAFS